MAEHTNISWCDHTINWWIGCTKVSPACDGCYAENLMANRYGRVEWGVPGKGNGTRVRTSASVWNDPFRWDRKAEAAGTRPFVFSSSLSDIFDKVVPREWRRDAFDVMRRTPGLVYLLLTKRPLLIERLAEEAGGLPPNAAIGTTVEDQTRADINVPALLDAAASLKPLFAFLSCEPLLGPIDLRHVQAPRHVREDHEIDWKFDALQTGSCYEFEEGGYWHSGDGPRREAAIGWVITGGETDQGKHRARPTHPDWFRKLRDQCAATGTPYHHKQNGEWVGEGFEGQERGPSVSWKAWVSGQWGEYAGGPVGDCVARVGKLRAGRLLDGIEHNDRPKVAP